MLLKQKYLLLWGFNNNFVYIYSEFVWNFINSRHIFQCVLFHLTLIHTLNKPCFCVRRPTNVMEYLEAEFLLFIDLKKCIENICLFKTEAFDSLKNAVIFAQ